MAKTTNKTMMGILFIAFCFLLVFILISAKTIKSLNTSSTTWTKNEKKPIGVVEIEGVILDSKKTVELLLKAEEDKNIKAILVRINSPGGAVGPSQEIYEEIRRINEEKPVYASFGSVAASGGYYIGAAARKIFSNPGTLTGSIGVIMQFVNLEKMFEFLKMDPETLKAGRYKDIGSSERKMNPEEKQILQGMLDGVHKQFISDVLKTRKDRIKGDFNLHAQGQIFSGKEAHRLGLVDELLGLHQAGRKIHDELKLEGKFGLKYFKTPKKLSLENIFEELEGRLLGLGRSAASQNFPLLMFLTKGL
ncbi:MAG: signal peptide peptidase SppA [Bacteriovoracales bacterium]|nr:signal peptide peptidase SppA [Bacteriovoracales bacterium]